MVYSYSTNIKYAVRFQSTSTSGEVLYLKFYTVYSEQFTNDEILLCKRHDKSSGLQESPSRINHD